MTGSRSFSLDTPSPVPDAVYSGYNFREVAPELLSPLTWSIVGSGMEHGFRSTAERIGFTHDSALPRYVGYLAFRPFFTMTTIEEVTGHLPAVGPGDVWELLLGGAPPTLGGDEPRRPSLGRRLMHLPQEIAYLLDNGDFHGRVTAELAKAEGLVGKAVDTRQVWTAGAACGASVAAGRLAWALHIRTTCVAMLAASLLRRALTVQYDDATALELLRAAACRKHEGQVGSARPGRLRIETHRLSNYEVADESERFAAFSKAARVPSALMNAATNGRGFVTESALPTGTLAGAAYDKLTWVLERALAERERSKELGLRALHTMRVLLDSKLLDIEPGDAALLGANELRDLGRAEQQRLIAQRAEELAAAAACHVAVDVRMTKGGLEGLSRPGNTFTDGGVGKALAGGWGEGEMVVESDADEGRIVVGQRVDGNYVLAVQPNGVIVEHGSVLSHVAIVCRELGIPLVSGIRVDDALLGRRATVDGWTGTVNFAGAPE